MALRAFVFPLQKLAKGGATMAVAGFLFSGEFSESLSNLGEVEQRIVSEAVGAARHAQDETFSATVKRRHRVPVARRRNHTDKASGAVFVGNVVQFAQQASVIGLIAGIGRRLISLFRVSAAFSSSA